MFRTVIFVCLLVQLSGCGTLFYPERRGQKAGEIDAKIAVADGVGLLFGIIPGVIAYIVDYSTGAIYLPYGHKQTVSIKGVRVVRIDPDLLRDNGKIGEIIIRETGISAIEMTKARVFVMDRSENIPMKLAEAKRSGYKIP